MRRASATDTAAETAAAAMTMSGRAATPKLERKSASRVALPAIWNAIMTVPAATAAATARRSSLSESKSSLYVDPGPLVALRDREGQGICSFQVRQPHSAAGSG